MLRNGAGRGTVVLVGIVDIVRVELDLAVVEVEVRRVVELAIAIVVLLPPIRVTGSRGLLPAGSGTISFRSCILFGSSPALTEHLHKAGASSNLLNAARSGKP